MRAKRFVLEARILAQAYLLLCRDHDLRENKRRTFLHCFSSGLGDLPHLVVQLMVTMIAPVRISLALWLSLVSVVAFVPVLVERKAAGAFQRRTSLLESSSSSLPDKDENNEVEEQDWRAFRAQMVQNERGGNSNDGDHTALCFSSSWVFEQPVIEQGSVLIHHPPLPSSSNNYEAYGLHRQFLHKSIVLVLERTPERVLGLVLNRPTDSVLGDKVLEAQRIRYGGDHFSIHDHHPKFFCLHTLKDSKAAKRESTLVMSGLYFTSITSAHELVRGGHAESQDFCTFCGFTSWTTGELELGLAHGLWRSTTLDADALLHGVLQQDSPWESLLARIDTSAASSSKQLASSTFNDRMLQEWSRQHLVFGDESPLFLRKPAHGSEQQLWEELDPLAAGDLVCAKSSSAFLLDCQEYHKSIVLILQDDADLSVACLLNHPTSDDGLVPIRFGGCFGVVDSGDVDANVPPFVLHRLDVAVGGEPVGHPTNRIWKASTEQAQEAIDSGAAALDDFLIIKGMQVWTKDECGMNFLHEEYRRGRLERVVAYTDRVDKLWDTLRQQKPLTTDDSLDANLRLSRKAWNEVRHAKKEEASVELTNLGNDAMRVWTTHALLEDENDAQP